MSWEWGFSCDYSKDLFYLPYQFCLVSFVVVIVLLKLTSPCSEFSFYTLPVLAIGSSRS